MSGKGPSSLSEAVLVQNGLSTLKSKKRASRRKRVSSKLRGKQPVVGRSVPRNRQTAVVSDQSDLPVIALEDPSDHSSHMCDQGTTTPTFAEESQNLVDQNESSVVGCGNAELMDDGDGMNYDQWTPGLQRTDRVVEHTNQIAEYRWSNRVRLFDDDDDVDDQEEQNDEEDEAEAGSEEDEESGEDEEDDAMAALEDRISPWDRLEEGFLAEASQLGMSTQLSLLNETLT